jgi:hypothetical protein
MLINVTSEDIIALVWSIIPSEAVGLSSHSEAAKFMEY